MNIMNYKIWFYNAHIDRLKIFTEEASYLAHLSVLVSWHVNFTSSILKEIICYVFILGLMSCDTYSQVLK